MLVVVFIIVEFTLLYLFLKSVVYILASINGKLSNSV